MDQTKEKQQASARVISVADIADIAGHTLANTPDGKGEKREASSPLMPPGPQHEKKSRDGSSSAEYGDNLTFDDDVAEVEPPSSIGISPGMHIFSKPMHPTDILQIATELRSLMLPEIAVLIQEHTPDIKTIVFEAVKEATRSLTVEIQSVKSENAQLKNSHTELEKRVVKLELENDALEQYGRRNILRISGIPEQNDEDTDDIVLQLASDLDVPMTKHDIDRSHRVGKVDVRGNVGRTRGSKKSSRGIIVKFTTYNARHRLFQKRKELRDSENEYLKSIYMNEDLTKFRSEILFEARSLRRTKKLKSAYSSDGKIFIYDNNDKRQQISSLDDLIKYGYCKNSDDSSESGQPQPSTSGTSAMDH